MTKQSTVIDETRKVLELMEESEEKVSILRQDLMQNEHLYEQLKQELKALQELQTRSSADLEENQTLKNNIKDHNLKLVNFAQHIYSCGQQLYKEISLRENEFDTVREIFDKHEEKYLENLCKCKIEEDKLRAELELIDKEDMQAEKRKTIEFQVLLAENNDLKNELEVLNEKIEKYEEIFKKDPVLDLEEIRYKEEIANMKEYLRLTNDEITEVTKILEEIEIDKKKFIAETENYISELDKKLTDLENEMDTATKTLEENKTDCAELVEKLKKIDDDNNSKQEEYETYTKLIKEIESNIKDGERTTKAEIAVCEKSTLECEGMKKLQLELNSKLKMEIDEFKIKVETLNGEINLVVTDIDNVEAKTSKIDLHKELESKQAELEQLKCTRRELKEKYNMKLSSIQIETKKLQSEIEEIEVSNKELQSKIDTVEMGINEMRESEEDKANEKLKEDEISRQLDTQIRNVACEIVKIKSEPVIIKKKANQSKVPPTPKNLPSTSNIDKRLKIQRHWDSDSSIEGEDRRFSEMAKQKIRMRKYQGHKP